jgi:hypothetical protein
MDRLDPFTHIIRSLWRSRSEQAKPAAPAPAVHSEQPAAAPEATARSAVDLRERLGARMKPLVNSTPERRCEVFVETVLLWELSESAGADPRFAEIVGRVVRELRSDTRVSARLDELLTELPAAVP